MHSVLRRSLLKSSRAAAPLRQYTWAGNVPMTKIVATIGPASEQLDMLKQVTAAGMRIMRINFSHATYDEADLRTTNLRQCPGVHGHNFNLRAVMLDTQGPEIRTGSFQGQEKEIELISGTELTLTTNEEMRHAQTKDTIFITYKSLVSTVKVGDSILVADGEIELKVSEKNHDGDSVSCTVMNNGALGNRKSVNLPGAEVNLPPMSDKDREDIRWGIRNDIDFIAASFTRKASDVTAIREYCKSLIKEFNMPPNTPPPRIIAKIENLEALKNLDSIIAEAEGIMVARGDLGMEIPMETLSNVQKDIVKKCKQAGKPVIVATQMLESMQKNPRPTRAECTDVSNAVLDGADCVMLSGESAKGKYPVQSVNMMYRIVNEAEGWIKKQREVELMSHGSLAVHKPIVPKITRDALEGMASAAVRASRTLQAKCIIVLSTTGTTAINIAKFYPDVPIVAMTPSQKTGRFLQLHRGIHPVLSTSDLSSLTDSSRFSKAIELAKTMGFCKVSDTVIIVSYETELDQVSAAVSMRVATVTEKGSFKAPHEIVVD